MKRQLYTLPTKDITMATITQSIHNVTNIFAADAALRPGDGDQLAPYAFRRLVIATADNTELVIELFATTPDCLAVVSL